jgi:hypothetical protein
MILPSKKRIPTMQRASQGLTKSMRNRGELQAKIDPSSENIPISRILKKVTAPAGEYMEV